MAEHHSAEQKHLGGQNAGYRTYWRDELGIIQTLL